MGDFVPRTGAVIDRILRPEPLSREEQDYVDWATSRGLAVVCSRVYPDDDQDFEPFLSYELVVEEMINGNIHAYFLTVKPTLWPEVREHHEKLLRLGFERYKQEIV